MSEYDRRKIVQCSWCHGHVKYMVLQKHYLECSDVPRLEGSQKICSECQRILDVSQFPRRIAVKSKLESRCKECVKRYQINRARSHGQGPRNDPSKVSRPNRWVMKPCEWCLEYFSAMQLKKHQPRCPKKPGLDPRVLRNNIATVSDMVALREHLTSKKHRHEKSWGAHLKIRYGITLEQYEALYESQQGQCAICKRLMSVSDDKSRRPHVDHDHATGTVRSLLCQRCNVGIGQFDDDIALLLAAISYLTPHKPTLELVR